MDNLKLSKINQINKYKNYIKVDYRNSIFKNNFNRLNEKVIGAGNHDFIISNKKEKTFMTFNSESPFGKLFIHLWLKIIITKKIESPVAV